MADPSGDGGGGEGKGTSPLSRGSLRYKPVLDLDDNGNSPSLPSIPHPIAYPIQSMSSSRANLGLSGTWVQGRGRRHPSSSTPHPQGQPNGQRKASKSTHHKGRKMSSRYGGAVAGGWGPPPRPEHWTVHLASWASQMLVSAGFSLLVLLLWATGSKGALRMGQGPWLGAIITRGRGGD
jgi:hypothetical protein